VDRGLNVIASGYQHDRFFKDVDAILVEVFDRLPLEDQPTTVADMGCGDGAFLERVFTSSASAPSGGATWTRTRCASWAGT
jgi:hypothetical protein